MNKLELSTEFENNCKANLIELRSYFEAYDTAKKCYDEERQRVKECHNKVLAAVPFYAVKDCKRVDIKAGQRITNEHFAFLMSEEDFTRYLELSMAALIKEGIIDTNGRYMIDWLGLKGGTRRSLINFVVNNILPFEMQLRFDKMNITHELKLIEIIRLIIEKAA